jgi:hypothetical protein
MRHPTGECLFLFSVRHPDESRDPTPSHRENTQMDPDFRRGDDGVWLDCFAPLAMTIGKGLRHSPI